MDSERVTRITVLKVPVDVVRPEELDDIVKSMFDDGRSHQIVLLSLSDLLRARRNAEYRAMLSAASLVLPISSSIVKGARFLKREEPVRYSPFDFSIRLLGLLDRWNKSAYLLGAGRASLERAERNIKATFPALRVVGRHPGHWRRSVDDAILTSIRKSTPTLLLVGRGVHGGERWIPRNVGQFKGGLYLWCSDLFDVFAERHGKPSRHSVERGREWLHYLIRRPWKCVRFLGFTRFRLLLLWYRIRGL